MERQHRPLSSSPDTSSPNTGRNSFCEPGPFSTRPHDNALKTTAPLDHPEVDLFEDDKEGREGEDDDRKGAQGFERRVGECFFHREFPSPERLAQSLSPGLKNTRKPKGVPVFGPIFADRSIHRPEKTLFWRDRPKISGVPSKRNLRRPSRIRKGEETTDLSYKRRNRFQNNKIGIVPFPRKNLNVRREPIFPTPRVSSGRDSRSSVRRERDRTDAFPAPCCG